MAVRERAVENLVNPAFWRGRRVFLTGHTGFKGAWLSIWLDRLGAALSGMSLPPPTSPSLFESAELAQVVATSFADIRDHRVLAETMCAAQPEVVFHLAAQSLVRVGYQDPVGTYGVNVMGTVHLLEAVRSCPSIRAVVIVTSDKCYANMEWPWGYRENEPMGGHDPYSNSKGCAELVVSAYRSSFFNQANFSTHRVAVASARAGNVIGGGDWAGDRLVPDFIRAMEAGELLRIRSPKAIRPWQHVLEPLSGYLILAQRLVEDGPRFADAWNFGPSDQEARPVEWLVEELNSLWGGGARWLPDEGGHPHEANHLKLDSSKAQAQLGWSPHWNLPETLAYIVDWHRAYRVGGDAHRICLDQISAYEACTDRPTSTTSRRPG